MRRHHPESSIIRTQRTNDVSLQIDQLKPLFNSMTFTISLRIPHQEAGGTRKPDLCLD